MHRLALPVLVALACLGCGADDDPTPAADAADATAATTTAASAAPKPPTDQIQLRHLGNRYIEEFRTADWLGVCETLSPRARARLQRKGGSCQAAFAQFTRKDRKAMSGIQVNDARITGNRAVLEVGAPGEVGSPTRFYAAKLEGRWYLYIKRAAKGAP